MAREIHTTWSDYRGSLDRLLAMACDEILIWDPDLRELQLDSPQHIDCLRRLLTDPDRLTVRIVVQDATPLRLRHPRLMELLSRFHHTLAVRQSGDSLTALRDALVIADGRHALIRFDRDHPRCKFLVSEREEVLPYVKRFEEIWAEEGTSVSPTTLGL